MTVSTNLFTGLSGASDGIVNGVSQEVAITNLGFTDPHILPLHNEEITVHVVGVWDGAIVTGQKFLGGAWHELSIVWDANRMLEGLIMEDGSALRINLQNAGGSTALQAYVGHGYALT